MINDGLSKATWKEKFPPLVIVSGLVLGAAAAILVKLGNPGNMGLCIACFERDIAGALGLHQAKPVQYLRPEILGIVIGAAIAALMSREFAPRSGSAPVVKFLLGVFMMIGALIFLGCPIRMVLRLGGGDGNALLGIAGFITGITIGVIFLRRGTALGRSYKEPYLLSVGILPLLAVAGAVFLMIRPNIFITSQKGPGSMYAPVWISLSAGIVVGILGQRSRLCFAGGLRDMMLFRSSHLLTGLVAVFLAVLVANLALRQFHAGFANQPAAHQEYLWNFLGMMLVGLCAILLGGCPFRQLILAAQGNGDSFAAVLGMITGAAFAHNFGWAASGTGVPTAGMIAVGAGLLVCVIVGVTARES